ncbi:hypothetical protein GmHk_06G016299 [Glycine max]|nr:hypothetical protein GmHk_06G016299 [Glycine max]
MHAAEAVMMIVINLPPQLPGSPMFTKNTKNEGTLSKNGNRNEEKERILKQAQPNSGAKRASGAKRETNCRR